MWIGRVFKINTLKEIVNTFADITLPPAGKYASLHTMTSDGFVCKFEVLKIVLFFFYLELFF